MTYPYLDCAATTPMEGEVVDIVLHYSRIAYGNAGSRTHSYGLEAKRAVEEARVRVAKVVDAKPDEVVFTSGATEANNLALLGLAQAGEETGRKHVLSTQIEHKAVLEPLAELERRGFQVELVPPTRGGWVDAQDLLARVRDDTLLVSLMQVNNETGVLQPVAEVAEGLGPHEAYFHVDAAQGYGKELEELRHPRIDLISASAHKIHGPKGVGALLVRRRGYRRLPLRPLLFGGGQERGLRPGTLPVPLVAGFGLAAEIALRDHTARRQRALAFRQALLRALSPLDPHPNGDPARTLPHVLNVSLPGLDSEAALLALKGHVAASNGSACTSASYTPSHVLSAMGLPESVVSGALRFSWCHLTEEPDWGKVTGALRAMLK